jgi:cobaltochelatase CobS
MTTEIQTEGDAVAIKTVSLAEKLGIADMAKEIEIEEGAGGLFVPPINPRYRFRREIARVLYGFFTSGDTAMTLVGLQGSGKSSAPREWHARLGYALLEVTCNEMTEMSDLIGMYKPDEKGGLTYHEGPLLVAARNGISLTLDEYNTLRPGVAAGLHPWIEGTGMYIPELKEFVRPVAGFRVFMTCNPADASRGFMGRVEQDAALEDRSWSIWVDYPKPEDEIPIVSSIFQESGESKESADMVAGKMVEMATQLRKKFAEGALQLAMSTRGLCRWATCACIFSNATDGTTPLSYSLELAYVNKLPDEQKAAVKELSFQMFGG